MEKEKVKLQSHSDILQELVQRYQQNREAQKHLIVCISGFDASGKSTIAERLQGDLNASGIPTLLISGDDFLNRRDVRYANPDQALGYYQESFNYRKLYDELLIPLRQRSCLVTMLKTLDLLTDQYKESHYAVYGPTVILVEGVFLLRRDLPDLYDFKIWVDVSFKEGVQRACSRERDLLHYGSVQAIRQRYLGRLYRGQLLHWQQDKPSERCNAIVRVDMLEVPKTEVVENLL